MTVFGLVTNRQWWRPVAIGAVILSQMLILIWWPDAKWGTIVNVLIIMGGIMLEKPHSPTARINV